MVGRILNNKIVIVVSFHYQTMEILLTFIVRCLHHFKEINKSHVTDR